MEETNSSGRQSHESVINDDVEVEANENNFSAYSTDTLNLQQFELINEDEVEVVQVDPWVPSRINSLFYQVAEESKKTIGGSINLDGGPVVLVTHENVPVVAINKLKERYQVIIIEKGDSQKTILQKACGVNAIFLCGYNLKLDREMLDFIGTKLVVVALMGAGYDHVDVRELTFRKIKIGNTRSVLTESVAEVALGLAIAVAHRFKEGYLSCTKGKWVTGKPDWLLGKQLSGSVCGIVGFGDIGSAIAKRLVPFKVKKIIYSGHGKKKAERDSSAEFVSFEVLLSESDFIFIACPLTDETKHLFRYETFRLMRPTCVLINVGRGGVVKTDDLVKALRERLLWGAGLDVTDPEPLPHDHPLLHVNNCFVTPHIGSATITTREAMALLTADNIIAALEGLEMPSEVCFKPDLKGASFEMYSSREPTRIPANHVINISAPKVNKTEDLQHLQ